MHITVSDAASGAFIPYLLVRRILECLLTNLLGEFIEGGLAAVSVAEKTYADAFPIA